MAKPRVVIVDDDADFRAPIKAVLINEGIMVEEAESASQLSQVLESFQPDMVLLDVNLPDDSGFNVARHLKQNTYVDVVMLSSMGEVEHRVSGLNSGADYYLPKPVDMRELLAVIHNRFTTQMANPVRKSGRWTLDAAGWLLITPDDQQHPLNSSEFALLNELAKQSQLSKPSTREALYTAIGKPNYSPESRSLDLHMSRLRQRLSSDLFPFPIKTVRNVGYELTEIIVIV